MFSFNEKSISDYFMSRLKRAKKRTTQDELMSYLFGRETLEFEDTIPINLITDELSRNNNNIKKIDIILRQFSIKNRDSVIDMLVSIYEANGYVVSHLLVAVKTTLLPSPSTLNGLNKEFTDKMHSISLGGKVSNEELIQYFEQIRLVLVAKAMGAIEKKKTRITYSATTDKNGKAKKKFATSIVEEVETVLPTEQVLASIDELSIMILKLQSRQSVFPTEEELAERYRIARMKSLKEKESLLEDKQRF